MAGVVRGKDHRTVDPFDDVRAENGRGGDEPVERRSDPVEDDGSNDP